MPITLDQIKEGQSYRTPSNQHRRVVKIDGDTVHYESWGGDKKNFTGHLPRVKVNKKKFADDVGSPIPCPGGMRPLADVQAEIT